MPRAKSAFPTFGILIFVSLVSQACSTSVDREAEGQQDSFKAKASTLLAQGIAEYDKGNFDRALENYNLAIRLTPDNAAAFNNLGNAYSAKGEFDRAIPAYDKAIRLVPDYRAAFYNRGTAYLEIGDYDRAIQDYGETIRLRPESDDGHYNRGSAYALNGEYDPAVEDFSTALRLNQAIHPDSQIEKNISASRSLMRARILQGRGVVYLWQQQFDQATRDLNQALRLEPDSSEALRSRGYALFTVGDHSNAARDFRGAQRLAEADLYDSIWLYLSQARDGRNGADGLRLELTKADMTVWPATVAAMYLGQVSPEQVLVVSSGGGSNTAQQRCEAYFHVAQFHLLQGRTSKAAEFLRKAVDTKAQNCFEYHIAKAELDRLGGATSEAASHPSKVPA